MIYAPIWTVGVTTPRADNYIDLPYGTSVTNARTSAFRARPRPTPTACPGAPSAASRFITPIANSNPAQLFIQNLWNSTTRVATVNGVANTSVTCTNCHNTVNLQNQIQVPAGQLDLTGGTSGRTW